MLDDLHSRLLAQINRSHPQVCMIFWGIPSLTISAKTFRQKSNALRNRVCLQERRKFWKGLQVGGGMDVRYILLSERKRQSETGRENNNARWLECRVKQLNNHRKPYISIIFTSCCITGVQNAKLINLHEKNVSNLSDLILHMHALCRNLAPLENTDEKKNTKILKGENLREIEKDGFGEKSKEDWSKKEGERRYNCCLCYKKQLS